MPYRLLISIVFIVLMVIAGYYLYRFLNEKIKESNTWPGILFYAVLLFVSLGGLLVAGLWGMIMVYNFLVGGK